MKLPPACNLPTIDEEGQSDSITMSSKIVRRKLTGSKHRLVEKIDAIEEKMEVDQPTKYQAARYLMEVEKKIKVFEKHLNS